MVSAEVGARRSGDTGHHLRGAAERIEVDLTRAILRGVHQPGSHLPPVRRLAELHGVTPATVQRALARLEARGLVTARQGSGLWVNDPAQSGDLSLLPDRLVVSLDDPDRAASILADLLEVRRVLAARLIARHRAATAVVLGGAADLLADLPEGTVWSPTELWEADLALAQRVVAATGNVVVAAVLAALARAVEELPVLVEAMYDQPARNLESVRLVAEAVLAGGPEVAGRVEAVMADVDVHTVDVFRRFLARERP